MTLLRPRPSREEIHYEVERAKADALESELRAVRVCVEYIRGESYRAALIRGGLLRPASEAASPSRQASWVDTLPCLPLRGIYRGDAPRAVSVEAFEAFEAHAEARAGWFPR